MTRTGLTICYLAEMTCADEVIGNPLTSGDVKGFGCRPLAA
jgi:hypothetical protein